MRHDKGLQFISDKLAGRPVQEPPDPPMSREKAMTAGISASLKGGQAPRDITGDPTSSPYSGDQTDQTANDGTGTAEEEARSKLEQLDPEILAAIDNPDDELHATAVRLLAAYTALVTLERKKVGPA
jgi:hypothetical protein